MPLSRRKLLLGGAALLALPACVRRKKPLPTYEYAYNGSFRLEGSNDMKNWEVVRIYDNGQLVYDHGKHIPKDPNVSIWL